MRGRAAHLFDDDARAVFELFVVRGREEIDEPAADLDADLAALAALERDEHAADHADRVVGFAARGGLRTGDGAHRERRKEAGNHADGDRRDERRHGGGEPEVVKQRSDEPERHRPERPETKGEEDGDGAGRAVLGVTVPGVVIERVMMIDVAVTPELRTVPGRVGARHHELEQQDPEAEDQRGEVNGAHEGNATMRAMLERPRRNRRTPALRAFARETVLSPGQLVLPLFVQEGQKNETPIGSMPGQSRLSVDLVVEKAREARALGVGGVALFPVIPDELKDPRGSESTNASGLLPRTVKALKQSVPGLVVITDVALDPYSSDGHDGVLIDGRIDNDVTLPILSAMAVTQANAGADVVAPSDMMDGRVGAVRRALDEQGFTEVGICSYCVKYASAFYGPFRGALDSAPRSGDKKTYQLDPANVREGEREIALDEAEGADWLMVKPGLPYADVIRFVRERTALPVAAYHVSGEYAMLKAAAERGFIDYDACLLESLLCLRRAGASIIFTYAAIDAARLLAK